MRNWLARKLVSLASRLSTSAIIHMYYPPDSLLHEYTVVYRGSKKINVPPSTLSIEVYIDGVDITKGRDNG